MAISSLFSTRRLRAFTVVELVIVIAVIGILTAVVIVGYGAWQKNIRASQVKSDLKAAAAAMENARNFDNTYPTSVSAVFTPSQDVSFIGSRIGASGFCLRAQSLRDTSIVYGLLSTDAEPIANASCQIPPAPTMVAESAGSSPFAVVVYVPENGIIDGVNVTGYKFAWRASSSDAWIELPVPTLYVDAYNFSGATYASFVAAASSQMGNAASTGQFRVIATGAGGDSPPATVLLRNFNNLM